MNFIVHDRDNGPDGDGQWRQGEKTATCNTTVACGEQLLPGKARKHSAIGAGEVQEVRPACNFAFHVGGTQYAHARIRIITRAVLGQALRSEFGQPARNTDAYVFTLSDPSKIVLSQIRIGCNTVCEKFFPARTKKNCRAPASNTGPSVLQADALPTEVSRHLFWVAEKCLRTGRVDKKSTYLFPHP